MTYVYFDESGDLGFDFSKKGTSEIFSIAFLIIENRRPIISLVKKVFSSLPVSQKFKHNGALHASYEKTSTVKRLLNGLATKNIMIAAAYLEKRNAIMPCNPNELYSDIVISQVRKLLSDGVLSNANEIVLVASQRNTSKNLNARFSERLTNSTIGRKLTVSITKPTDDKCLQAADFVSWALWQKYAKADSTFVDIISSKIVQENEIYRNL